MLTNKKNVSYIVIPRKNPMHQEEEPKYYMKAHATEFIGVTEISRRIEKECTVTRADVMAVLTALEDVIADAISQGQVIKLGELGTFKLSISSKGAEDENSVNGSLVTGQRILFRPGAVILKTLRSLSFSKYTLPKDKDEVEEPTPGPENSGD